MEISATLLASLVCARTFSFVFFYWKSLTRVVEVVFVVCWWNEDRFEESVIEERRRTAQDLLNFVGQRVYLTNSVVFKQFFQVRLLVC